MAPRKTTTAKKTTTTRKRKPKEQPFAGKLIESPLNEVVLTDEEREQLIDGIRTSSTLLGKARLVLMGRSRVEIPKLVLGGRAVIPTGGIYLGDRPKRPSVDPVILTSSKFAIPLSITEEFIEEQTEWRSGVLKALTHYAGDDLEDIALNGNEHGSGDELMRSNDGWLIQARRRRRFTLGRSHVRKGDILRALGGIEARFRQDENLIVVMSTLTYKRLGIANPYGIEPWVSAFMPENAVFVTHRDNLILGIERTMKLRQTSEGQTAIERDERHYAGHVRLDFALENTDGACVLQLVSVPELAAAAYQRTRQRIDVIWRRIRYPEIKRRLWNLQTAISLVAGLAGGFLFEALRSLGS